MYICRGSWRPLSKLEVGVAVVQKVHTADTTIFLMTATDNEGESESRYFVNRMLPSCMSNLGDALVFRLV